MKAYKINVLNREYNVIQDDDGKFLKSSIIEDSNKLNTALKPAYEPIILARKPIEESTIAKNVMKYGIGGINIDGCRINGIVPSTIQGQSKNRGIIYGTDQRNQKIFEPNNLGRWPANFIIDDSEEVLKLFPYTKSGELKTTHIRKSENKVYGKDLSKSGISPTLLDIDKNEGSAARFFYCAKASPQDRNEGLEKDVENKHETVKPLDLMKYLVRLITPKKGVVLDCFCGSTGRAAVLEGFDCILIDENEESLDIAKKRTLQAVEERSLDLF